MQMTTGECNEDGGFKSHARERINAAGDVGSPSSEGFKRGCTGTVSYTL